MYLKKIMRQKWNDQLFHTYKDGTINDTRTQHIPHNHGIIPQFVLDESRQNQLAETVPLGMQELPIHLQYRRQITAQQQRLENLPGINPHKKQISLDKLQDRMGIRMGVTEIHQEYLYSNHEIPPTHHRVIILVIPMNYDAMITAPSLDSATEILRSYAEGGKQTIKLTELLRELGYEAMAHHPMGDRDEYHHLLIPPHAVDANLGERGRTGLFIDYEHGPTVRLGAVTTNAPLQKIEHKPRGITEFCHRCKYCVRYCPPRALPDGTYLEQVRSGDAMDFKINAHRCFKYFQQHNGCGRCIVHCILAEPNKEDIARRMTRIEKWYQKWVVSGKLDEMYEQELNSPAD